MTFMVEKSCSEFIDVLASKAPVPGGGGAAALGGAIGLALSNMVGNLTLGKKKYLDVEPEVKNLIAKGYQVISDLKTLVDKDAEVFEPLSKAYGLPKNTPEEIQLKEETLEKCSKIACSVPMDIMRKAYEGIKIHQRMGQIGTRLAISDVGCGVSFMKAALISGKLNVIINLNSIKDRNFVQSVKEEMDHLVTEGSRIADETLNQVFIKLSE